MSSIAAAIVLESKNCAACASLAPASAIVCMSCVCGYVHVYAHAHAHIHMHTKHIHTASARERNRRNQREQERQRERARARASARERGKEGEDKHTHTHTHTHTHRPADRRTYHTCTKARLDIEPGIPRVRSDKSQIRIFPSDPEGQKMRTVGRKVQRKHRFAMPLWRQKSSFN